jgi:TPR repeat protein
VLRIVQERSQTVGGWVDSDPSVQELVACGRYADALALAARRAAGGDREAQRTFAEMLFHGEPTCGVPALRDRSEAGRWFRRAAAQGCPISRYYLDWYYSGAVGTVAVPLLEAAG